MLIVNQKALPSNAEKDSEMYDFVREYRDGVKKLKNDFPTGKIMLQRLGYPQRDKLTGLPEFCAPIFMTMQKSDSSGNTWAYCKGTPVIHANGLRELRADDKFEELRGEVLHLDVNKKEDYAFYIMFKSGLLGVMYNIHDPEGDKIKALREKNERLNVQFAIRNGMDEQKLRTVAAGWGIQKAFEKDILLLQDDLETLVFALDEKKKKEPTNLQLKGITEFLAEIKSDDHLMPKALVQMALDYQKIQWEKNEHKFFLGDIELCTVPYNKITDRVEFLAAYLRHPDNKEKWERFLLDVIDQDYVNGLNKYGVRWLAGQVGIPLNQHEKQLRESLLDKFQSK